MQTATASSTNMLLLGTHNTPGELTSALEKHGSFNALACRDEIDWPMVWTGFETLRELLNGPGKIAPRLFEAMKDVQACQRDLLRVSYKREADSIIEAFERDCQQQKVGRSKFTFFHFEDALDELLLLQEQLEDSPQLSSMTYSNFKKSLANLIENLEGGYEDFLQLPMYRADRFFRAQKRAGECLHATIGDLSLADMLIVLEGIDPATRKVARYYFEYPLADIHWSDRAKSLLTSTQAFMFEVKNKILEEFYTLHDDQYEVAIELPSDFDRSHAKQLLTILCSGSAQKELSGKVDKVEWRPFPYAKCGLEFEFTDTSLLLRLNQSPVEHGHAA